MFRTSSLAILATLSMAVAAPAMAELSIQKGQRLCEQAVADGSPGSKSVKVRKADTHFVGGAIVYTVRLTKADGAKESMVCTIDRETSETRIAPEA